MYVNVIKYFKYCTVQSIEPPQEFFLPKCCDHKMSNFGISKFYIKSEFHLDVASFDNV